jgi:TPR repeat protein
MPKPQPATGDASAGAEDFYLATEYLNGRRGPRDSAEAAKFLWKAVGKENPSAILLLSDMYLVGDGVPKSCDQARLLLNAAVRKNVPHAAQKFRNLQTAGCP